MKRKTFEVEALKKHINELMEVFHNSDIPMLQYSKDKEDGFRLGISAILEYVLMETNNYKGFNNLEWIKGGCKQWELDGKPDFPEKHKYLGNDTKRIYF